MSNDIVIRAEGLGKKYLIGHEAERERYTALRDVVARGVKGLWRKAAEMTRGRALVAGGTVEEFWALKDVSFEVKRGEVLGIIGRNGAGKSTLLKILSRITEPSEGRVTIKGRVASLLEVGTGFHPELSGRENIYLNGAILGMTRAEIRKKFDEIVAFAEVEKFLDTPVKRYSSGMYVRLAFAVAAHLEPEILVIDEVLAVGDAEFQKKCLGKMSEVAGEGRTVLFVSHDLRRVATLCQQGILLDAGQFELGGPASEVVERYLTRHLSMLSFSDLRHRADRTGSGEIVFEWIELLVDGKRRSFFNFGESITHRVAIRVKRSIGVVTAVVTIFTSEGAPIYELYSNDDGRRWAPEEGIHILEVVIDGLVLYPGTYSIDLWVGDRTSARVDLIRTAISFRVIQAALGSVFRSLNPADAIFYQPATWRWLEQAQSLPAPGNDGTNYDVA